MKKVACFGSAVVDIMLGSDQFRVMKSHQVAGGVALCEVYGGKMELESLQIMTGGAGTNVAVGLRRLGISSLSVSRVGEDVMKEIIMNDLKKEGVVTELIQVDTRGGKTGVSVILVAAGGGRTILTHRGVAKKIESSEVEWNKIGAADLIHVSSLGGEMALIEDILGYAKKQRRVVSMNPGKLEIKERMRLKKLLMGVEILIVNKMEAVELLHWSYDESREKMVAGLRKWGVGMVVVTEGIKGASLGTGERVISMEAIKSRSVDDTGAGDGFISGLLAGYLQGEKEEVMLKMGMANGASVVTKFGAKTALLDSKKMNKWLQKKAAVEEMAL